MPGSTESSPLLASSLTSQDEVCPPLNPRTRLVVMAVLPMIIATYFAGQTVVNMEINPYLYDKIAREYPQFNVSSQQPCSKDMHNKTGNQTGIQIQNEIETRVSNIELYMGILSALPAVLPVFILGPITDRFGRKIGFLFPITGVILQQVTFAVVIGLDLDPSYFYIGQFFVSLGGGFAAMLMTMFGITADITTSGKQRALGIAVMEGLQTMFTAVGATVFAQWIKVSYLRPLITSMAVTLLSLILALTLPETSPRLRRFDLSEGRFFNGFRRKLSTCIILVKRSFLLYGRDAEGRLAKRRLAMAIFVLTVMVNFSKGHAEVLYFMKFPLCWSSSYINTFNGIRLAVNWVCIWIILAVLQSAFNFKDRQIALIGCISSCISEFFFSLANNTRMVYEAVALGFMIRAIIPMIRSVLSSLVSDTEQGAVFAGLGCVETVGVALFRIIFNRIYIATLDSFPGTVFAIFSIAMLVALVVSVLLNALYKKEKRSDEEHLNWCVQ